jgi:adenylate kinase
MMPARKIVILLGNPGAGKGTQAKEIMRSLKIPQISTGDMLREAMTHQNGLGKEARKRMETGGLVNDATVNGIIAERIVREDCGMGFILDGYPRTVPQAETLQQHLKGTDRLFVIEIRADDSRILRRLISRLMCPACGEIYNTVSRVPRRNGMCDSCKTELVRRSDDREDLILGRFKTYREETFPLVEHYRKTGCYHKVDGHRPIAEVTQDIRKIVDCEER